MKITFNFRKIKTEHITENGERFLNITEMRLYSENNEKIFLEFAPVRIPKSGDIMWEDWNYYNSLRIFKTDYEMLFVPFAEKIFPVKDPDTDELQTYLDLCSPNWIGKSDIERLIKIIDESSKDKKSEERQFLKIITEYLQDCIKISNMVLIDGNL